MLCQFKDGVCPHCGRPKPPVQGKVVRECLWQLGDDLEEALTAIGVTKDTWRSFKAKFGLPPNCNCEKRKAWLNAASANLHAKLQDIKFALREHYDKAR
jgi:NMD protein affecting ribosome stability and mRNA decay